jgi:hypothetical protein
VYQNLVHGDRFFEKYNNQTHIDHAKITCFFAMENNQVRRKIPILPFLENTWNFWWNRRLIIVDVKVCPV